MPTRIPEHLWQSLELPALDETRCNGCGWCVQVCPTDCLEMNGPRPWMPRPAHCVSCALCALVCPAEALQMCAPRSE